MEENEIERKLQKLKLNGIKWNWKEPAKIKTKLDKIELQISMKKR